MRRRTTEERYRRAAARLEARSAREASPMVWRREKDWVMGAKARSMVWGAESREAPSAMEWRNSSKEEGDDGVSVKTFLVKVERESGAASWAS